MPKAGPQHCVWSRTALAFEALLLLCKISSKDVVLCAVVASDWLNTVDDIDEASLQELHTLMADTFLLSPAHLALAALVE